MAQAVPLALRSALVKLDRAELHADTAKRAFEGFVQENTGTSMRIDQKDQTWAAEHQGWLTFLSITVERGFPSLPQSLSAMFGDAIHNYRCALDHIAWELVQHGTDPTPKKPKLVQFPISDTRNGFRGQLPTQLPGVGDDPVKFIESCYRYEGGKATNKALLLLAKLSNHDKHRSLHTTICTIIEGEHQVIPTNCRIVQFVPPTGPVELKAGAEAGEFVVLSSRGTQFNVEVKPQVAINVAVEDAPDIIGILAQVSVEVTRIVYAPEICDAVYRSQ